MVDTEDQLAALEYVTCLFWGSEMPFCLHKKPFLPFISVYGFDLWPPPWRSTDCLLKHLLCVFFRYLLKLPFIDHTRIGVFGEVGLSDGSKQSFTLIGRSAYKANSSPSGLRRLRGSDDAEVNGEADQMCSSSGSCCGLDHVRWVGLKSLILTAGTWKELLLLLLPFSWCLHPACIVRV